jgi:hypothetical protein
MVHRPRQYRPARAPAGGRQPTPQQSPDAGRPGLSLAGLAQVADWDGGSRGATLADLQRRVGNRAVARALAPPSPAAPVMTTPAQIGARAAATHGAAIPVMLDFEAIAVSLGAGRSVPVAPPDGAQRIRSAQAGGTRAAGYTELPAPTPPELKTAEPRKVEGGWVARVQPTANDRPQPTSLYPAPGVHQLGTNAGGQQQHLLVTQQMSEVIRQGEAEHLLDLEWARHLSYDRAAAAINAAADSDGPVAATPDAARQGAEAQVCAALPPQLRWARGTDPVRPWVRAYSRMAHVTIERDEAGWHAMTSAFVLDPAEKRAVGVPIGDELTRYVGGPQVGQHPSAPLVRERFAELPPGGS